MSNLISKLKKYSKSFKTAKKRAQEEGGFGAELPDGRYKTKLTGCELTEAQSSGRLQVAFSFKVTEGESKGETIRMYQAVETEDDQVWLERTLRRFGIELENLEELPGVCKMLEDAEPEVRVTLKTKDSGQFTYIDKLLSELDLGDYAAEETGEEEEESEEEETEDAEEDEEEETEEASEEEAEEEEETEEETEEEEEADLEVGMSVGFEGKGGKEISGKVIKILEKTGEVKVKSGDKTYTVAASDLYILDADAQEEEEEEEEAEEEKAPAKKAAVKKVAPAKAVTKKKVVSKKR